MKTTRFGEVGQASTPGFGVPSGPAGGDLGGSFPGPGVTGIQGTPVCTDTPDLNDVLTFDGSQWCPAPGGGPSGSFLTTTEGEQGALVVTSAAGATATIDCALANTFDLTLTANCTLSIIDPPPAGVTGKITVILRQGGSGSYTVTWPGSVAWQNTTTGLSGGSAPTLFTAVGAQNVVDLSTEDGGVSWGGDAGASTSFGTPAIVLGTAAVAGSATTAVRTDATIVAFDATVPTTQAFGDAATTGSAAKAARRDHLHGMPTAADIAALLPPAHVHVDNVVFSGDGSTTTFELPAAPVDAYSVAAYVAGVRVGQSLSGAILTTLTFDSAPASGTNNITIDIAAAL